MEIMEHQQKNNIPLKMALARLLQLLFEKHEVEMHPIDLLRGVILLSVTNQTTIKLVNPNKELLLRR